MRLVRTDRTVAATRRTIPRTEHPLPAENMSGHTKKLRFIMEQLRLHMTKVGPPVNLLDFGCGNGTAVSRFLIADGVRYRGVEIHEPSRSHAARNFGGEYARFLPAVPGDVRFDGHARHHFVTTTCGWCKNPVVSHHVKAWTRDERGEFLHEFDAIKEHVRRAVPPVVP